MVRSLSLYSALDRSPQELTIAQSLPEIPMRALIALPALAAGPAIDPVVSLAGLYYRQFPDATVDGKAASCVGTIARAAAKAIAARAAR
ncbi:MAG: hypothetical protein A4S16_01045 [Proteobacteria bacterium SG_bin6]|nr:MAG: hypothetical protein A4S16_01045 [Proteobacteria bacterium SG_bin6]